MKRIEEFTAEELFGVYLRTVRTTAIESFRDVLDYIKANLDTGKREPMSHNEVLSRLYEFQWNWEQVDGDLGEKVVQSLDHIASVFCAIHGPAPKMRQKTTGQLCQEWVRRYSTGNTDEGAWALLCVKIANGESIHDLCRAAGIPLDVQE